MPEYNYRAIDDYGKSKKGTLVADTETHLEEILNGDGYYLLEASEIQAIVRSGIHKPEIVDSQEEGEEERGWQQGTKPPGGGELHLHKHEHVYAGLPPKKMSKLSVASLVLGIVSIIWSSVGFIPQLFIMSVAVGGAGGEEEIKGFSGAFAVLFSNPAFYFCLAAIITGYKALSRCKRLDLRGKGLAVAGLIMGGFAILGPIIIALLFW